MTGGWGHPDSLRMEAGCQGTQSNDQRVGTFSFTPRTLERGQGLEVELITMANDLINHAYVTKPPLKTLTEGLPWQSSG